MDYKQKCCALKLLPLEEHLSLTKCLLVQKVVHGKAPQYLEDLMIPSKRLRVHGNKQLLPRIRLVYNVFTIVVYCHTASWWWLERCVILSPLLPGSHSTLLWWWGDCHMALSRRFNHNHTYHFGDWFSHSIVTNMIWLLHVWLWCDCHTVLSRWRRDRLTAQIRWWRDCCIGAVTMVRWQLHNSMVTRLLQSGGHDGEMTATQ